MGTKVVESKVTGRVEEKEMGQGGELETSMFISLGCWLSRQHMRCCSSKLRVASLQQ